MQDGNRVRTWLVGLAIGATILAMALAGSFAGYLFGRQTAQVVEWADLGGPRAASGYDVSVHGPDEVVMGEEFLMTLTVTDFFGTESTLERIEIEGVAADWVVRSRVDPQPMVGFLVSENYYVQMPQLITMLVGEVIEADGEYTVGLPMIAHEPGRHMASFNVYDGDYNSMKLTAIVTVLTPEEAAEREAAPAEEIREEEG